MYQNNTWLPSHNFKINTEYHPKKTSLIALFVLWFGGSALLSVLFAAIYGGAVAALAQPGLVPGAFLWYGQAANIPMVLVGKMLQVMRD